MQELYDYMEGLIIGQGREAGEKLKLYPWQKRFLRGAFSQPDDAALTLARGGGKTTFVAGIACATLDGPLSEPMAETLVVASSSFDQGLVCFRHVLNFLQPVMDDRPKQWRVQDSERTGPQSRTGTTAQCSAFLGSDPRRLHGSAPKLILGDEIAQWPLKT